MTAMDDEEDRLRMLLKGGDFAGVADLLAALAATRRQEMPVHAVNCRCRYCQPCRKRQAVAATRDKWARRRAGATG